MSNNEFEKKSNFNKGSQEKDKPNKTHIMKSELPCTMAITKK